MWFPRDDFVSLTCRANTLNNIKNGKKPCMCYKVKTRNISNHSKNQLMELLTRIHT